MDEKASHANAPREGGRRKWATLILWLLLIGLFVVPYAGGLFGGDRKDLQYTRFKQYVKQGRIRQVTVSGQEISGHLLKQQGAEDIEDADSGPFVTYFPSIGDKGLLELLESNDVKIVTEPSGGESWLGVLVYLLPFLLLIGLGVLMWRGLKSRGQGLMGFGRSRARLYDRRREKTTFEDVAGSRGAKTELSEVVGFLKDPGRYVALGGKTPKGVLLLGPPGSGKTLLARAVAGEADVPFFSITGSDFMEMFVGVGASRVRAMFEQAKKVSPSIVFIDELDSIGRHRGAGLGTGHDEREQTLNQLLSELDGFEATENVVVMGATNRPDILDPALLRPGRFDRRIVVDLPTMEERIEILEIHARGKPIEDEQSLRKLARITPGFSGADLENILNEAALLAARKDKRQIQEEDMEEARDKIIMGLERESMALTDEERRMVACHEAGHAVVAGVLPNADPLHKVTIVPRGRSMGSTQQLPEQDRYLYTREYMRDRLAVMLGGRAAEELMLGEITSGVENDLREATERCRQMVMNWGMSERFRHISLGGDRNHVFLGEEIGRQRPYSEGTAREIDEEIHKMLSDAYLQAYRTLQEHREGLGRVAEELMEKEVIDGKGVLELINSDKEGDRSSRAAS